MSQKGSPYIHGTSYPSWNCCYRQLHGSGVLQSQGFSLNQSCGRQVAPECSSSTFKTSFPACHVSEAQNRDISCNTEQSWWGLSRWTSSGSEPHKNLCTASRSEPGISVWITCYPNNVSMEKKTLAAKIKWKESKFLCLQSNSEKLLKINLSS